VSRDAHPAERGQGEHRVLGPRRSTPLEEKATSPSRRSTSTRRRGSRRAAPYTTTKNGRAHRYLGHVIATKSKVYVVEAAGDKEPFDVAEPIRRQSDRNTRRDGLIDRAQSAANVISKADPGSWVFVARATLRLRDGVHPQR